MPVEDLLKRIYAAMYLFSKYGRESTISREFMNCGVCDIFMSIQFSGRSLWSNRDAWRKCLDTWPLFNGDYAFPIDDSLATSWRGPSGLRRLSLLRHMTRELPMHKPLQIEYLQRDKYRTLDVEPAIFEES